MASKGTKTPLKFNAWTLGGHGAEIFEKSAEALNLERLNPLRGVNEWRLGQIFDDARDGIYADLAWLYAEIEAVEPALASCCDMRESAASECGWIVKTADADRTRGFDQTLADEQRTALLSEFGAVEDDLAELAGHLVSAFFRGAAHAQPLWNEDGTLAGFRHLDLWNFAFDRQTGLWYWNADASRDEATFQPVPPGEIVSLAVSSRRHVDHAALPIFIRAALGAKRYGVWLDRFGIPPVGIIMPPNAEKGEQSSYMDLARKFARGGSGILPNGSSITYGTEARAVCPFQDFIRFQQEQVFMLGIGRIQSGANDAASLGGNAAGVVENGFRRIVRRDARQIARAINDCVTRKVLDRLFPGRPALAQFAWDTETKRTSREVLEDAGFAKNAGLAIDIAQIQELTGYKLAQAAVEGPGNSGLSLDQLSALIYPLKAAGYTIQKQQLERATKLKLDQVPPAQGATVGGLNAKTPFKTRDFHFKNAPRNPDGRGEVKNAEGVEVPSRASGEAVLEAAAKDTGPAADAIRELMEDPTPEKAKALMARLPELLPEDPALATVFADAMAEAYAGAVDLTRSGGGAEVANSTTECRAKDPAHCPTHGTPREPETKSQHDRYGLNDKERLAAEPEKNAERGRAALDEVLRKRGGYVDEAVYRPETGWIRFDWGDAGNPNANWDEGGHGISHIAAKHPDDVKHLPEVIAKGEAFKHPTDSTKTYFVYEDRFAVVASLHKGAKKTITEYAPDKPKQIEAIKKYPRAAKPGENKGG